MTTINPRVYQAMVLRSALELLSKGIKPNSAYTLKATLKTASQLTGKPYKQRDLWVAYLDLTKWIEGQEALKHD